MKDSMLRQTALSFRNGLLGKRDSGMMCMAVCYPLQGFLSMLGVETKIEELDFGKTNHVILRLQDGRILDPTADQFSGPTIKLPKVYVGPMPEIYQRWIKA